MSEAPDNLQALLASITPEIHQNLKRAVELGRWENGERLSPEQVELCLQAIIAYDEMHLSAEEKVGYIDRSKIKNKSGH
ncbi:MAG: hypothetical protein CMP91_06675 [Gammaproteobacteria bacterium]|nr:hypothetical protein [Gammaproteobacteria bacterium]MAY02532.1 hypothetical protein [Gammaproteobacteria bacterium]